MDTETISACRFRLYWLFCCLCFTRRRWLCDFPPKLIELFYIAMPVVRTHGLSGGRCTVTWLPNFLGWVDYLIFLAMVLRWRASRARDPLIIVLSCTHKCLALTHLFLKEKHTINKKQTPNGTSFNFHKMFKVFNLKTTFLDCTLSVKSKITLTQ